MNKTSDWRSTSDLRQHNLCPFICSVVCKSARAIQSGVSLLQDSMDINRPPGAKGVYWKTVTLCTTMGPAVRVSYSALKDIKSGDRSGE